MLSCFFRLLAVTYCGIFLGGDRVPLFRISLCPACFFLGEGAGHPICGFVVFPFFSMVVCSA